MISKKNPFPGMNPYLESRWPDVHTSFLGYMKDAIAEALPTGLVARAEEAVEVDQWEEIPRAYRADVAVRESWRQGIPPTWQPETNPEAGGIATVPEIIRVQPVPRRWLEITTSGGKVVTVIEVLSPGNKTGTGRERYVQKQFSYLESDVNLVVIDLIRSGQDVLPIDEIAFRKKARQPYNVVVARPQDREARELYRIPLRQRLPIISVPLRASDKDLTVDLQPLIDRCYLMGGYWQSDYTLEPEPPVDEADKEWLDECLRTAGLR